MKKDVRAGMCILTAIAALALTGCPGTGSPGTSGAKQILGFTVTAGGQEVQGSITETAHTITLFLPAGTDVTDLTPLIILSEKAAVSPASGAAQDFTNPVTYRVTAEDGTARDYTVRAVVALPLDQTVEAAKAALEGVAVSADGSDVAEGQAWVSAEAKAALEAALAEAEAALADPAASAEKKAGAEKALAEAQAAFTAAMGKGAKEEPAAEADKTALDTAITEAEAAKTGIMVNTAAADVPVGAQWVTQAVLDTFNAAIDRAKAAAAKAAAAQAELDEAAAALKAAAAAFDHAKQAGAKLESVSISLTVDTDAAAGMISGEQKTVTLYRRETPPDKPGTARVTLSGTKGGAVIAWRTGDKVKGAGTSLTLNALDYSTGTYYFSVELEQDGAPWSAEFKLVIKEE
jgi:hypothetical protein